MGRNNRRRPIVGIIERLHSSDVNKLQQSLSREGQVPWAQPIVERFCPPAGMCDTPQLTELQALQATLNCALNVVNEEIQECRFPPLRNLDLQPHPLDDSNLITSPRLYEARRLAIAAMGQIKNLLQNPFEKVREHCFAVYDSACLDIFVKTGILDFLAELPDRRLGADLQQLHEALDLDSVKLAVILRYLSTQGWLNEREEGIFCLTRSSLELCRGRGGRALVMTPGRADIASKTLQMITHPEWRYSTAANHTAFQLANDTSLPFFSYLEQKPELLDLWGASIKAFGEVCRQTTLTDYPWESLGTCTFVDCGGGHGDLCIDLSKLLPGCRFVIQERPEMVPMALANLSTQAPEATQHGRITVESHDFFTPQIRRGDSIVYLLRHILHNWSDDSSITILKLLAEAAGSDTKVLIIDMVIYPCIIREAEGNTRGPIVDLDELRHGEHYQRVTPPAFIPANMGSSAKVAMAICTHMMSTYNSYERSESQWRNLLERAGLAITRISPLRANESIIECEPVRVSIRCP